MQSLWNEEMAASCAENPLEMRVYSSRLLGCEPSLVLHGGGNTSVKAEVADLFGERKPILYEAVAGIWRLLKHRGLPTKPLARKFPLTGVG